MTSVRMRAKAGRQSAGKPSRESPRRKKDACVRIKRVYEPPGHEDGARILVDRLWPRGVARARAEIDLWLPDVAPSTELRRRLHAAPLGEAAAWSSFQADYALELEKEPARTAAHVLLRRMARGPITLLYAAREEAHNNAVALKAWLTAHAAKQVGDGR